MTVQRGPRATSDDLTGVARVRDAAMQVFAERGRGATVRDVAERAGVSPALVIHHFGSKSRLWEACDAYALTFVAEQAREGLDEQRVSDEAWMAALTESSPPVMRYLARALTEGSERASTLFDRLVELARTRIDPTAAVNTDAETLAAVLTAMRLGVTVLHEHLTRHLGADVLTTGAAQVSGAVVDVVAPSLYRDPATARAVSDGVRARTGRRS